MIKIKKSPTADTRTCDVSTVTRDQLLRSSSQHIDDVGKGLAYFASRLTQAAVEHDRDKLTEIDWFYRDFITKFEQQEWWVNHQVINRHHLNASLGVPEDVNLIDVIEYITDCVMAGMARSGSVYDLSMSSELLMRAFRNTIELLKSEVVVEKELENEETTTN